MHGILVLTTDPVSNVRVNVADLLAGWAPHFGCPWEQICDETGRENPWIWLLDRADIKECVKRLSRDDNDVYLRMRTLSPLFPHLEFSSMSCRGLKEPPGGTQVVQMVVAASIAVVDSPDETLLQRQDDEASTGVDAFDASTKESISVPQSEQQISPALNEVVGGFDEDALAEQLDQVSMKTDGVGSASGESDVDDNTVDVVSETNI